jgi:putative ABC transport system ATP-binding protein
MTPPAFEARGLCKRYRLPGGEEARAIDDLSLLIENASFTVLTGPSGSGKTTLLALLGGLERPTSGQALFHEKDLARCSDHELTRVRRRLGLIFQDASLIPDLSAIDNITYPLLPRGVPRRERQERAMSWLARLDLEGRAHARARTLSGGEQQRVGFARALAGDPEAILADEPTSSLDADTASVLLVALREVRDQGKTVVVATHDPQVTQLATHTFALKGGRLAGPGG